VSLRKGATRSRAPQRSEERRVKITFLGGEFNLTRAFLKNKNKKRALESSNPRQKWSSAEPLVLFCLLVHSAQANLKDF